MSELVPDNMSTRGLEAFLHEKIPLTKAMGLHVAESNAQRLVLEAPLDKNVNHLGTAFGGSLHALPTLACYAGLWTLLREAGIDGHVVVKRSAASYRAPVKGVLRAVCMRPAPALAARIHRGPPPPQEGTHGVVRDRRGRRRQARGWNSPGSFVAVAV